MDPQASQSRPDPHGDAARRAWKNWLILATTLVLSTLAILTVTLPTTAEHSAQFWPWKHTDVMLRAGLFVVMVLPILRLSVQTRELLRLRSKNFALEREVQRQVRAEEQLVSENETLEQRVADRTATLEERTGALQLANAELEEKNLRLLELNRAAHSFVDNVSHEFRTPLTVIKEYTSTLRAELSGALAADTIDFFDVIENRVDDLGVMVNDLLDISRLEADIMRMSRRALRPEDILQRVQLILERKAAHAGVEFEVSMASDLPRVFCDPEKIGRVLINLGLNGIKFARSDGNVKLSVRLDGDSTAVRFGVSDDGPGIPPEQLEMIFQRFSQAPRAARTSTKGFGLGLAIAKELVTLNLGDLHLKSSPGNGSVFWFSIPRADPDRVLERYLARVGSFPKPSPDVSLVRIDVCDDDPQRMRDELHGFLENQLRRSDILFDALDAGWVLVAATHSDGVRKLLGRLRSEHSRANQARPLHPLADFRFEIAGTWRAEGQSDELTRTLRALLGAYAGSMAHL